MGAVSRFCVLILIVSGVLLPETVGAIWAGYSDKAQYLSELSAQGAPYAQWLNYGSLLPIALAIIILVIGLYQKFSGKVPAQIGAILLLGIAVGYLGAFFFPCQPGCPAEGDTHQMVHNLGGLIEYTGAITGLILIFFGLRSSAPPRFSALTLIVAILVLAGFSMMLNPHMLAWKGAWQRLAEYSFILWFAAAVFLKPLKASP